MGTEMRVIFFKNTQWQPVILYAIVNDFLSQLCCQIFTKYSYEGVHFHFTWLNMHNNDAKRYMMKPYICILIIVSSVRRLAEYTINKVPEQKWI